MVNRDPLLKINTVGYFGISGMAYYFGGQPVGGWTDGYWNFGWADVLALACVQPACLQPGDSIPAVEQQRGSFPEFFDWRHDQRRSRREDRMGSS